MVVVEVVSLTTIIVWYLVWWYNWQRGLVVMLVVVEMAMANKVVVVYGGDGYEKVVVVRGW